MINNLIEITKSHKRIEYLLKSDLISDIIKYNKENDPEYQENIRGLSLHIYDVQITIEYIQYIFSKDEEQIQNYIESIAPNNAIFSEDFISELKDREKNSEERPLVEYKELVNNYLSLLPNINQVYKQLCDLKIIKINSNEYYNEFMRRYLDLSEEFGCVFIDYIFYKCKCMINEYETMSKNLQIMPETIEEYLTAKQYLDQCRINIQNINEDFYGENGVAQHQIFVLEHIPTKKACECLAAFSKVYNFKFDITTSLTKCTDLLLKSKMSICEELDGKRSNLSRIRTEIAKEISDLYEREGCSVQFANTILQSAEVVNKKLIDFEKRCNVMNTLESSMSQDVTNYGIAVGNLRSQLTTLIQIWENVKSYFEYHEIWYNKPFKDWNVSDCTKESNQLSDEIQSFLVKISNYPNLVYNLQSIKKGLETFILKHRELALLLGIPGIKDRHWNEMEKILGFKFYHGPDLCLSSLLKNKMDEYVNKLIDIINTARGEYRIESSLEKMKTFWNNEEYVISPPNDYININHIQGATIKYISETIEDQLVRCDLIIQDKYHELYEEDIKKFARVVKLRQNSLKQFSSVQESWIKYAAVFSTGDLKSFASDVQKYYLDCESIYKYILIQAQDDKYWKDFLEDMQAMGRTEVFYYYI